MAASTPRPANSPRPTTSNATSTRTASTVKDLFPYQPGGGSPTWQQAYDMSRDYLNNSVQQGREVAREASNTKSYYEGLQSARDFNYQQTQQANANTPAQTMQSQFQNRMDSNWSGGRTVGGAKNTVDPNSFQGQSAALGLERSRQQMQDNSYRTRAATDNYYDRNKSAADQSFQSQMAGNDRYFKSQEADKDRVYQQGEAAKDRAQQRQMALLDSQTKIQASMLQSLNMGSGGGYQFW